jgi:hypothetical protein
MDRVFLIIVFGSVTALAVVAPPPDKDIPAWALKERLKDH